MKIVFLETFPAKYHLSIEPNLSLVSRVDQSWRFLVSRVDPLYKSSIPEYEESGRVKFLQGQQERLGETSTQIVNPSVKR